MRATVSGALILFACGTAATLFGNSYHVFVIGTLAATAIVAIGLNVLLGLAGQISLGHAAFYAIGAYTASILAMRLEWNFLLGALAGATLAGAAGALLSVPALRVRGPYLAMVTIAFGLLVVEGAAEWKVLTGGWNGMMNIPKPSIAGYTFDDRAVAILALICASALMVAFARFTWSRWGLVMRATRDSEVAAQSLGANLVAARALAFAISAAITGFAGALFATLNAFISPDAFPFFQSILFLFAVMIGGIASPAGPVLGSIVVVLLPEMLSALAEYRLMFFGGLLLVVLVLAPTGIAGALGRLLLRRTLLRPVRSDDERVAAFLAECKGRELRLEGLSIRFGGNRAVSEVSMIARAGQVTSLIGPNGSGKTTMLNLISGFYIPDAGSIRLEGAADLVGQSPQFIARAGISRTFQTSQLFSGMSLLENLQVAAIHGELTGGAPDSILTAKTAEALLAWVGYRGSADRLAGELPHVDRRLVEIARALASRPSVLLLDEPAAGLSAEDRQRVDGVLRRIAAQGIAVVLIEHDMELVMGISDRIFVLDAGKLIASGTSAEIQGDPAVRRAYLGEEEFKSIALVRDSGQARARELLTVRQLTTGYGAAPVLESMSLHVRDGGFVAVLGPNGAGKSTLMRSIAGLHRPVSGSVNLDGTEIRRLDAYRIARSGLTLVPEGRQVFPELTVEDNIRLGAYRRGDLSAERLEALFTLFPNLRALREQRAGLLSGGEQQMLAIARGLASEPRMLLLDEPSLGLSPAVVQELFSVLARLRADGTTVLLVDQMTRLALALADDAYVITGGHIVFAGEPEALQAEGVLEKMYLGGTATAYSRRRLAAG